MTPMDCGARTPVRRSTGPPIRPGGPDVPRPVAGVGLSPRPCPESCPELSNSDVT
jgi:hypothetical protein